MMRLGKTQDTHRLDRGVIKKSRPISRVLSRTAIHLGNKSPCCSSNLPKNHAGRMSGNSQYSSIWSCSGMGFTLPSLLPAMRCALTTPFHPYLM